MPKAVSKAQKTMMGIVHAAQTGQLSKRKLNATGRRVAKTIQPQHSKEFADTAEPPELPQYKDGKPKKKTAKKKRPTERGTVKKKAPAKKAAPKKKAPAKKMAPKKKKINESFFSQPQKKEEVAPKPKMTPEMRERFLRVVAEYNRYGKILERSGSLRELAQKMLALVELAEMTVLEQADDRFDEHTIRRNMKEMKSYAKEFAEQATTADRLHQRITALYEDMGRILERYFEVYDINQKEQNRMNAIHEVSKSGVPFLIEGVRVDPYSAKVYKAASKVMGEKLHSLPLRAAINTAWGLIK